MARSKPLKPSVTSSGITMWAISDMYDWDHWRAQLRPVIRTVPIDPANPKNAATPEATAEVQLMFDEESAVERRIAEVLNKLFFAAPAAYRCQAAANSAALFEQMLRHAPANSPEFRKYIESQFKQAIESVIRDQYGEALRSVVADELRKELPQFEKYARRMASAPKGPRR